MADDALPIGKSSAPSSSVFIGGGGAPCVGSLPALTQPAMIPAISPIHSDPMQHSLVTGRMRSILGP